MSHEIIGLVALAISLLGTVIVTTWRSSAVTTGLRMMLDLLEKRMAEQKADQAERMADLDERQESLRAIPEIVLRLTQLEKNHSLIPRALERIIVLEERGKHETEFRKSFRSRPETEDDQ